MQLASSIFWEKRAGMPSSDFCWSLQARPPSPARILLRVHRITRSISQRGAAPGAAAALGHVPSSAASPCADLGQISSVPPGAIVHRS